MISYLAIGVDPSLTSTGLVVVDRRPEVRVGTGRDVRVLARATVTTKPKDSLYVRATYIQDAIATLVTDWRGRFGVEVAVIEDPTDQMHVNRKRPGKKAQAGPSSIAKLGLGVGAALCGLAVTRLTEVHVVEAAKWLPRQSARVMQRHEVTVDRIRRGVGLGPEATEDEVMAAGVAEWWLGEERQRELRRLRGIPEPPALGRRPRRRHGTPRRPHLD